MTLQTHDPFQPAYLGNHYPRAVEQEPAEVPDPQHQLLARLLDAGVTPEEGLALLDVLARLDPAEQERELAALLALTDDEFGGLLIAARQPLPVEQQPAEQQPAEQQPAATTTMATPATDVPDGTIPDVLAWVDGDPGRAQAALTAEQQREKSRVTLVEQLEDILTSPDKP